MPSNRLKVFTGHKRPKCFLSEQRLLAGLHSNAQDGNLEVASELSLVICYYAIGEIVVSASGQLRSLKS
jgi:hypothetical protein